MTDKLSYEDMENRVDALEREIEELKLSETKLKDAHFFRKAVIDRVAEGLCVCHEISDYPYVKFTVWNERMTAITGYTKEEINRLGWYQTIYSDPEIQTLARERMARMREGHNLHDEEWEITRPDGEKRTLRISTSLLETDDNMVHVLALMYDQTDRVRAEEALKEIQARYREIVEYTDNGVAVYRARNDGEDFIFVDFNRAGERIEKVKKEDILGKSVLDVFPGVKDFGLFEVFQRVWSTGRSEHFPVSLYKDERIIGWRENFVYKLPSGEIVAVYSDETEKKQAEEALRKAHEELRLFSQDLEKKVNERTAELKEKSKALIEAERLAALGKMANRVAHELRNPLTVIGGFARRMNERTPDEDPDKQYLGIIMDEIISLENKVREIIKL